jgi:hypothetical protein
MQRTATPCTPVRFRPQPPLIEEKYLAGIAQLVERNLAKVEVASSNLVFRSKISKRPQYLITVAFFVSTKASWA